MGERVSYLDWQMEALETKRVFVRAARRSGKTRTAARWARNIKGKVLYLVPSSKMIDEVLAFFETSFKEDIESYKVRRDYALVTFTDGTEVRVLSSKDADRLRGLQANAVVLDEVGYMSESDIFSAFSRLSSDFSIFITGSIMSNRQINRYKSIQGIKVITYDYLDALADGLYKPEVMRDIQEALTTSQFKREFGPYKIRLATNRNFKGLLSKE